MTRVIYVALAAMLGLLSLNVSAQETGTQETQTQGTQEQIDILKKKKAQIEIDEREALKREVQAILKRLEAGEITEAEAETLKLDAAERRARNIDNKTAIIQNQIELIERNEDDGVKLSFVFGERDEEGDVRWGVYIDDSKVEKKRKYDRRTTSDFVLALGFNNVITEGQNLDDSPYKIGGSRFLELGVAWKTRVFKNTGWLRVKYGFSFQFNGLKPTDNRVFVNNNGVSELQTFDLDLDKSKFRMDNLVIPVHFEIGPYKKVERETYVRYNTYNKFKLGIGGYAGVNLGSRQKLKFERDGRDVKEKQKGGFNTNNFVYGLSSYLSWGGAALYVKYDLNPIFENNPVEERMVSIGVRFDMD